jgi:membrane-associated phospholipid phosphatase
MDIKGLINKIDKWDQHVILRHNGLGGKILSLTLKFCSFFGRETLWIFLIFFYSLLWYDPFLVSYISATFLTGLILILIIKRVVKRPRPFEKLSEIIVYEHHPTSKSFPSWHSYNVLSQGLLIGWFFLNSLIVTIFLVMFAILVSISRIKLGVHYPSDVIFGTLCGLLGFLIAVFFYWTINSTCFYLF